MADPERFWTRQEIASAAKRCVASVAIDARNPECPLHGKLVKPRGGRAHVTTGDVVSAYLAWLLASRVA